MSLVFERYGSFSESLGDLLSITMPNRALASIMSFIAGMVLSGMVEPITALCGGLMILCTYCSQAVYNNLVDIEGDRRNAPGRPLARGSMSQAFAIKLMGALILCGFAFAFAASALLVIVNSIYIFIGIIYSSYTKSRWYLSYPTLTTSHLVLPIVSGYLVFGALDARIMAIAAFIYLSEGFVWSIKDYKDVEGDSETGVLSLPVALSARKAAKITFVTLCLPLLFVWIPWHVLGLSTAFLILYLLAGALRCFLGRMLVHNQSPAFADAMLKNFRYVLFLQMIAWCVA